ncbi:glycosyltransferase family 4 protein [Crocinitomix catalasitica]|nr:glycosyltransferase family 4 protein [Crocinitomix catalasitica]
MSRIKVCHLTSVHKHTDNRVFFKECSSLSNAGYDVSLIAPGVHDHNRNGVQIYGVPTNSNRLKRVFSTAFVHVFKKAKQLKADVYHFHDMELIPVGLMLRILGKKVIYDVHENSAAAILSRTYIKSRFIKVVLSKCISILEKGTAGYFNAIVTARPDISDLFEKHKPFTLRNFPILPNCDEIPEVDIRKTKAAVIYVGGMTEIRGVKELINAFEKIDEAELWLLGFFGTPEFEQKCKSLKGWKNVQFFGQVEAGDIFAYIKKADIGIVTFLPVPNHITTLATKPFEYMACGLPIIMSDFEYWRNFFQDSSLYVNPENEEEISSAIKKLLSDKPLMESMGNKNLELTMNEYNWEKESKVLLSAYDFALNNRS